MLLLPLLTALALSAAPAQLDPAVLTECSSAIEVTFDEGRLDLPRQAVLDWVGRSACAVSGYFGRFPVARLRLQLVPVAGGKGIMGGTTWGDSGGRSRVQVGEHATQATLDDDWVMTHEMVHLAFPTMDDDHLWLQEGIATYVEPLARSWVGTYAPGRVWLDLVNGLPMGMPRPGDEGLDHTHSWGRTYWGGALFCLRADVEIRRQTQNRLGLVDALRAILAAGGTNGVHWSLEETLAIGDKAVGVAVLVPLAMEMKEKPAAPDLDATWKRLGVVGGGAAVRFDDAAPDAAIRRAISAEPRPIPGLCTPLAR
jgi:hypothetical protein